MPKRLVPSHIVDRGPILLDVTPTTRPVETIGTVALKAKLAVELSNALRFDGMATQFFAMQLDRALNPNGLTPRDLTLLGPQGSWDELKSGELWHAESYVRKAFYGSIVDVIKDKDGKLVRQLRGIIVDKDGKLRTVADADLKRFTDAAALLQTEVNAFRGRQEAVKPAEPKRRRGRGLRANEKLMKLVDGDPTCIHWRNWQLADKIGCGESTLCELPYYNTVIRMRQKCRAEGVSGKGTSTDKDGRRLPKRKQRLWDSDYSETDSD